MDLHEWIRKVLQQRLEFAEKSLHLVVAAHQNDAELHWMFTHIISLCGTADDVSLLQMLGICMYRRETGARVRNISSSLGQFHMSTSYSTQEKPNAVFSGSAGLTDTHDTKMYFLKYTRMRSTKQRITNKIPFSHLSHVLSTIPTPKTFIAHGSPAVSIYLHIFLSNRSHISS